MAISEALDGKIVSCGHREFGRAFVDVISD
jgi:hypothetical protein